MTTDAEHTIAVVFDRPGGAEVLRTATVPSGVPASGEARIAVVAAAVHPADVALRAGSRPIAGPGPFVAGMAVAGVVDRAGPDSAWRVGDRVMTMTLPSGPYGGGYRGAVVAPDDTLARVPGDIDLVQAATLPMNGHTALQAVRSLVLGAEDGDGDGDGDGATVLVTGAAGALGALVVPLLAESRARVVAVARAGDREEVLARGASVFVEAGDDPAARVLSAVGAPVDAAVDLAVLDDRILPAVREGGGIATLRGWDGGGRAHVRVHPVTVPQEWRHGPQLEQLAAPRYLTRPVRAFAPDAAGEAHRLVEAEGLRHGVVIRFG
ncbi:alcohol dehydrogenase catalytic domain-containing protein [Microbacterium sp. 18062]|uniref:alcohol dehydrogenase catalytic domain-containing protein n=1 Tax=Microbacterium sp. 18062 TaxID=2681410 RepID=UPI00135C7D28|nr:alcohol dehydrogenase catalytic domain-containing protein [Microbacterium sp. 18062]